jgi:predicted dehydrogenase
MPNVGIIGCGGIASGKHIPAINKIPGYQITAFTDVDSIRAQKTAELFGRAGAKWYTDYRDMLEDPGIDSVRVLTANPTHCEITIAALEAGKHVLCEKPMGLSGKEADLMLQAAKNSNKILSVGYNHRFDKDVQYVKHFTEQGGLGDIYFAKARVIWRRALPVWRNLVKSEQGGGCILDIGSHALDTLLWLMNNYKPKYVSAAMYHAFTNKPECGNRMGSWKDKKIDVEDSGFAFIVMENGASVVLETSYALNTSEETTSIQYLLSGTKAGIDNFGEKLKINGDMLDALYVTVPELSRGGPTGPVSLSGSEKTTADLETENFFGATRNECELIVKPEQAAVVVKIIEGIYISANTGKPYFFI